MRRTEEITAVAKTVDERDPLIVQLVTVVETRTNRVGGLTHTSIRYEIHVGRDASSVDLSSVFESSVERDSVARRYYRTASFTPPTAGMAVVRIVPYPPDAIVGRTVTAFRRAARAQLAETSLTIEFGEYAFSAFYWPGPARERAHHTWSRSTLLRSAVQPDRQEAAPA